MNARLAAACAILLALGTPVPAHRLDEYLQATTISVGRDRVQAQIRLTPGVRVLPSVLASIDANGDGVISGAEQRAYAERVLRDLSLTVDGDRLPLRLLSWKFAATDEMREGRGDIQLDVNADVPRRGRSRRLIFENRHQRRIAAYLVNCLVPRDPDIEVTGQKRDYRQSFYQLDYVQASVGSGPPSFAVRTGAQTGWAVAVFLLFPGLAWLWWRRAGVAHEEGAAADETVSAGGRES